MFVLSLLVVATLHLTMTITIASNSAHTGLVERNLLSELCGKTRPVEAVVFSICSRAANVTLFIRSRTHVFAQAAQLVIHV